MVQAGLRIQSHSPHFPQFTCPPTASRNTYCILNYCITIPPIEPLVSALCFANTIPSSWKVLSPLLYLENCIHLSRPTWKVLPSFLNFFFFTFLYSFAIHTSLGTKRHFSYLSYDTQHFALRIYFLVYIPTHTLIPRTQNGNQVPYFIHLYNPSI